jgi:hypothetical protein
VIALAVVGTTYVASAGGATASYSTNLSPGESALVGGGTSFANGTAAATFVLPGRPAASSLYLGVELRSSGTNLYRAKARVYPDGTVTVDLSKVKDGVELYLGSKRVAATVGTGTTKLTVEGHVSGSSTASLQGRVWLTGTTVPAWQYQVSDSAALAPGAAKAWAYLSRRAAAPIGLQIIDITARADSPTTSPATMQPTASPSATLPPIGTVAPTVGPTPSPAPATAGSSTTTSPSPSPSATTGSLPAATKSFSDFSQSVLGVHAGVYYSGSQLSGDCSSSVIRMVPGTSTKAGLVPTAPGSTNQIYLMAVSQDNLRLECFTLQGTEQGHLYNGIRMHQIDNGQLRHLKLVSPAPGNNYFPPGETFGINDFRGTNNTFADIEIDGGGRGASAFAANSSVGGTWTDVYAHDDPYAMGIALWQTSGTQELVRFKSARNRTAINLERVQGTVNVRQPTISSSLAQDLFVGNDWGSTKVNIYDPILPTGTKLKVYYPSTEQGRQNLQRKSDIKVYKNGVDVSSTMIQWLGA